MDRMYGNRSKWALDGRHLNFVFRLGLLLSALYFFTGCGVKSTAVRELNSNDFSSSEVRAECNEFSATGTRLSGKIKSYTDNAGNTAEDIHQIKFSDVSQNFENDSKYAIRFFRWKAFGTTSELDSEPLEFRLEVDNGFGTYTPATGYMTHLDKNDIQSVGSSFGIQDTEVSAILRKIRVVVFGTDFSYQALKVVLYNEGSVVGDADLLIPVFDANPAAYASTHADVLNQLHPFYGMDDLTNEDLQSRATSMCSGF